MADKSNPSLPQRVVNAVWNFAFAPRSPAVHQNQVVDAYGRTRAVGITGQNAAGQWVDSDTALQFAAVWACTQVIAQDIGVLGWHTYETTKAGKQKTNLPVSWLLKHEPNPEMTAQTFRETLVAHCLLMGNGYAEIERNNAGEPIGLWPLLPDRTKPVRVNGVLTYASYVSSINDWVEVPAEDMFHIRGLGFNGLVGYDVISYASKTIGTGLAAQEYSASFFGNGTHLSGGLFSKETLSDEARDHLRQEFETVYRGGKNAFKMAVFEEGLEWKPFSVSPEAARVIETRKHELREVARWFRVKPHKIGDLDDATYANIENESIDHVGDTILPWAIRFEQEADRKLFSRSQRRRGMFTKLNIESLRRGDMKSQNEAFALGREWGWYSANDILTMLNRNTIGEVGDIYILPLNYTNAERFLVTEDALPIEGNEKTPGQVQMASAIRPLANEAVERIHTRELHRMKELSKVDPNDDSEYGRRIANIMEQQTQYARQALAPVMASALYVLFPDNENVPVMVDKIIEPVLTSYVVRHGEKWRDFEKSKLSNAAIDKQLIKQMVDEMFHAVTKEGVAHNED